MSKTATNGFSMTMKLDHDQDYMRMTGTLNLKILPKYKIKADKTSTPSLN